MFFIFVRRVLSSQNGIVERSDGKPPDALPNRERLRSRAEARRSSGNRHFSTTSDAGIAFVSAHPSPARARNGPRALPLPIARTPCLNSGASVAGAGRHGPACPIDTVRTDDIQCRTGHPGAAR
ncbi:MULTISPECIES: hypothetical protein [Burkholderia]|uniref:hypothetical protein n=1 Tax=Burkholderia TaxID=32008 RepID=UPI001269CA50|nr:MULTISPECIES: hypothetical protein [Burkholderia]